AAASGCGYSHDGGVAATGAAGEELKEGLSPSAGVEPATFPLGGGRSIQLSYEGEAAHCKRKSLSCRPAFLQDFTYSATRGGGLPSRVDAPARRRHARRDPEHSHRTAMAPAAVCADLHLADGDRAGGGLPGRGQRGPGVRAAAAAARLSRRRGRPAAAA